MFFFSCFEFETWDEKVVTLSVRNFSFLVGKKKIIFLNNNCIKKLHNHLSELWDFVGVTLHLLVQNPFKEKWRLSDKLSKSNDTRACSYVFEIRNGYQQRRVVLSIALQERTVDVCHIVFVFCDFFFTFDRYVTLSRCSAVCMNKFAIAEILL